MITFRHPELLLALALPWALVFYHFARAQVLAVRWIDRHAARRFRHRLTRYGRTGLTVHLVVLGLLGSALVVAAAGPTVPGEGEVRQAEGGSVVLLLDASASMGAEDSVVGVEQPGGAPDRFGRAQGIALELVSRLQGHRFAVATFSGLTTWQLPMTADSGLVADAVGDASFHNFYRRTGSSFGGALDAALHFASERRTDGGGATHPNLQVVLLSDGEAPRRDDADYGAPLDALEESGVPVHSVALGSAEGQGRVIYDFREVLDGVEEPAVLVEFHTRRQVEHLRRISRRTGGRFLVDRPDAAAVVAGEIGRHRAPARVEDPRARRDLAGWVLALFLVAFVVDALLFDRRRPRGPAFDLDRLGPLLVLLLLLPAAGCGNDPLQRAHLENEAGIARDAAGAHDTARPHYVRSIGYGVRSEIPTHNLGRSRTLAGDWSEAHDLYQRALELDPGLDPALYNDGVALWRWGRAELDPRGCQLERSRELWHAARERFAAVRGRGGALAGDAAANEAHVDAALEEVETLISDPPPECTEPPPPAADGDEPERGGGGEEDPEEGEDQDQDQGEGEGEEDGQQDPQQDPQGGPPPLSPDEEDEIRQALQRIREERSGEGKFFYRSPQQQYPKESWENPEEELWW